MTGHNFIICSLTFNNTCNKAEKPQMITSDIYTDNSKVVLLLIPCDFSLFMEVSTTLEVSRPNLVLCLLVFEVTSQFI